MAGQIRIGTRGSRLALWQAHHVAGRLGAHASPTIVEIETAGDQVRDVPLAQIGGEGVFTKEIQRALLAGKIDVAVHSLKDLPTLPVDGLVLAAVPARGPVGDVFISQRHPSFHQLPVSAVVATSSLRRRAQLLHRRPDLQVANIRGNVETRLRKLHDEGLDALVLAQAGLERLELSDRITEHLDTDWMLPAVGQGALGLECRANDAETRSVLQMLDDALTHNCILAERTLLRRLQGGCQVPLGALATLAGPTLTLRAAVLDPLGKQRIEAELSGPASEAEQIGWELAAVLLDRGAARLMRVTG